MPLLYASEIQEFLTCQLCKGYLVDATAITECLHSFCKSCLILHLKNDSCCPICKVLIHQSHPLNFIKQDRTLQDIVYKLIPGIKEDEQHRKKKFYSDRGLPVPEHNVHDDNHTENKTLIKSTTDQQRHPTKINNTDDKPTTKRDDEQIAICLEYDISEDPKKKLKPLKLKYIKCSSYVTVGHIKKFISKKLNITESCHREIDVLFDDEILGKDHTLKFLVVTRWKLQAKPLTLHYRPKASPY